MTALMFAATRGGVDAIAELLGAGAAVDRQCAEAADPLADMTALMHAAVRQRRTASPRRALARTRRCGIAPAQPPRGLRKPFGRSDIGLLLEATRSE